MGADEGGGKGEAMRKFKWSAGKFVETTGGPGDQSFSNEAGEGGRVDAVCREIGKAHDAMPLKQRESGLPLAWHSRCWHVTKCRLATTIITSPRRSK